jgi:hypothetical protein
MMMQHLLCIESQYRYIFIYTHTGSCIIQRMRIAVRSMRRYFPLFAASNAKCDEHALALLLLLPRLMPIISLL